VTLAPGAVLAGRHGRLRRLLEALELAAITSFDAACPESSTVVEALNTMGVTSGASVPRAEYPAMVRVAPFHSSTSAHVVNEVVEDEAWRDESRNGTGLVAEPRRQLFVWVDEADIETRVAMERDVPPEPPVLPASVTAVWVARRARARGELLADRVWQTNESNEWETLGAIRRTALDALAEPTNITVPAGSSAPS
jgi:hypothetical protein